MTEFEIHKAFGGRLVGTKLMKKCVCFVVAKMPDEIAYFLTKNCWFLSSMEDAWGFTFTGNDLKNQHLIFLSDELFYQSRKQIYSSIAHEIGHVVLGHRNSVFEKQTKSEVKKQEKEANEFAGRMGFSL